MTGMINGYTGLSERSAINALMEMMRNMQVYIDELKRDRDEKAAQIEVLQWHIKEKKPKIWKDCLRTARRSL